MLIKIKNFRLKTIIGIYPWEENIDREIIINITIETDFSNACLSDKIEDAIDYDVIINKIKNLVSNRRFKLIEKMAKELIDLIMEDRHIKKCTLEIDKVGVIESVDSFSVTLIEERKNDYAVNQHLQANENTDFQQSNGY